MDIKNKLKERLLEIPIRFEAFRELHQLVEDLNVESKYIELYLDELCENDILLRKIQYICPNCGDVTTMNDEILEEIIEDGFFECDNCMDFIDPKKNKTGYIYYDIKNKEKLIKW